MADLETPRLTLAVPGPRHFAGWAAGHAAAGPPASPYDHAPRPPDQRTRPHFDALLAELARRRSEARPVWFLVRRSDGQLAGSVTIFDVARGSSHSGFVGYHVFNHLTGQGLATEALGGLIELGFGRGPGCMGLHRLEACVEPDNRASRAVLARCGFRFEGVARRRILQRGAWRDVEIHAMTVEDIGRAWIPPD